MFFITCSISMPTTLVLSIDTWIYWCDRPCVCRLSQSSNESYSHLVFYCLVWMDSMSPCIAWEGVFLWRKSRNRVTVVFCLWNIFGLFGSLWLSVKEWLILMHVHETHLTVFSCLWRTDLWTCSWTPHVHLVQAFHLTVLTMCDIVIKKLL